MATAVASPNALASAAAPPPAEVAPATRRAGQPPDGAAQPADSTQAAAEQQTAQAPHSSSTALPAAGAWPSWKRPPPSPFEDVPASRAPPGKPPRSPGSTGAAAAAAAADAAVAAQQAGAPRPSSDADAAAGGANGQRRGPRGLLPAKSALKMRHAEAEGGEQPRPVSPVSPGMSQQNSRALSWADTHGKVRARAGPPASPRGHRAASSVGKMGQIRRMHVCCVQGHAPPSCSLPGASNSTRRLSVPGTRALPSPPEHSNFLCTLLRRTLHITTRSLHVSPAVASACTGNALCEKAGRSAVPHASPGPPAPHGYTTRRPCTMSTSTSPQSTAATASSGAAWAAAAACSERRAAAAAGAPPWRPVRGGCGGVLQLAREATRHIEEGSTGPVVQPTRRTACSVSAPILVPCRAPRPRPRLQPILQPPTCIGHTDIMHFAYLGRSFVSFDLLTRAAPR